MLAALLLAGGLAVALPSEAAPALRPGQYLWYADASNAPSGDIAIVISLRAQRAYVYRDGALIGVSTVSTGRPGKETPTGDFTILEKQLFHRSNLYSDAPMPYMQRLTWSGIALHAGDLPGYRASHGCIRLPPAFARQLFQLTSLGARVAVVDADIADPVAAPPRPGPQLRVDPSALGGEAFNVVTASTDPLRLPAAAQPALTRTVEMRAR